MSSHLPDLPLLLADVPPALRQALAQEGLPTADARGGRAGRFVLFDSRSNRPMLRDGQIGIDVDFLRSSRSCDPFKALGDERAVYQEWQIGLLAVKESLARVDRASIRRRIVDDLRLQVEAAGGIWLRVSPFPHSYQSAFNLRLDHDEYDARDFEATLKAIAGYERSVSHYVCASTHAHHAGALARLRGSHVGSHGWWHHTYRERFDNRMNIRRGIDGLRSLGIEPIGFAAPHGRFNTGLLAALEELGVTHSSEFGLAYDDLPFFPRESTVLQIPVHPICLGICLEAARRTTHPSVNDVEAARTTLKHWLDVVARKHAAREPIFLYGHPDGRLGRFPWLLSELFAHVARLRGVWCTTLAGFEQWWRQRAAIEITAYRDEQSTRITAQGLPTGHRIALELCRGEQVAELELDAVQRSFSLASLPWRTRLGARVFNSAPTAASQGLRVGLHRYLDWERVTPIEEISTRTWRGWAKRTLRKVRA